MDDPVEFSLSPIVFNNLYCCYRLKLSPRSTAVVSLQLCDFTSKLQATIPIALQMYCAPHCCYEQKKTREQNTCKTGLNRIMTERPKICYIFEKLRKMTFPFVNAIQLGPSPFNSSPQCKKSSLRHHFRRNS